MTGEKLYCCTKNLAYRPWMTLDSRILKTLLSIMGKHHSATMQGRGRGALGRVETATKENQLSVGISVVMRKALLIRKISSVSFSHRVKETIYGVCSSAEYFCFAFKRK